jgi:diguanylate cyclase (GGDEF)-like protein
MPVNPFTSVRHRHVSPLTGLPWLLCIVLFWLAAIPLVHAQATTLETLPAEPLGRWMDVLSEIDHPLTLDEAREQLQRGAFRRSDTAVPKFGIGARPVWLHLGVDNGWRYTVGRLLQIETSWLDNIDLHVVHDGKVIMHRAAGDADAAQQHPLSGLGYVFDLALPPGHSDILIRVATPDPMLLPVRLLDATQMGRLQSQYDFGYGLLYGFLLALIAYNALLYIGLRERSYLDYTLYVSSFVVTNLAYTGHGYVWLWPQQATLQQYAIPLMMVVFGSLGLRFADGFLNLRRHEPKLHRLVGRLSSAGLALILVTIILLRQQDAIHFAFVFVLLFSITMVWLGIIALRRGQVAARYFLAAALASMAGTATTALAVWFGLPYSPFAFHAAGWGMVAEGVLLALALAYRMRQDQNARMYAEQLARIDPLTGLLNRRAFLEHAGAVWSTARRSQRPLAAVMVDIDFFKTINDSHGHSMGDQVLQSFSRLLAEVCRDGDIVGRWGGEEFVIVLPETSAEQATQLAERLRAKIAELKMGALRNPFSLSASFGIAERNGHETLNELIHEADEWLYRAKQNGRNRVSASTLAPAPT